MVLIGKVSGVCERCGREYSEERPADFVVCDCYRFCPEDHGNGEFGTLMEPYKPDLTPNAYGKIEVVSGTAYGDLENPMRILFVCPVCNYHSAQKPVEVKLS